MKDTTGYSYTDRIALKIANIAIHKPWQMIALAFLIVAITASGAVNLGLSSNYRVFFSEDNPELVAFENFQDTYTKNDNIMFYVQPETNAVFSQTVADAIETLTEKAWQIPYVIRVDSISNFQHSWADGDDLTVEDLIRDGVNMSQGELNVKRDIAVSEPLLYGNVLSRDLVGTAVNVVLQYPELSESEVPEAVAVARQIEAEIESQYPDLTVALTGVSMLNNAFAESGKIDAATLIPAMYVILLLVTLLVLRSFIGMAVTFALIIMSTVSAMGIAGHLHIMLDPISLTAPIVIMTLAVADSIHILVTMLNQMRKGKGKVDALRESMRINFLAVSITSITTVIGFLSLNYSDSPPFNYLGNITAIGIVMAWIYSITFLPAILKVVPIKVRVTEDGQSWDDIFYDKLSSFITRRYREILLVGSVIAVGMIAVIPRVDFNDQWIEYFDQRVTFRTDTDYAIQHLPAVYPMEFSVGSKEPGGINAPEYLTHLERFTEWLSSHPTVEHVYSYTDIIKRLNRNMHGDDDSYYQIPEEQELAAQYLFLYEISLPFGLDLNDRINVDKSATRVTATLDNASTVDTRAFIEDSVNWLRSNTPEYMWTRPTSANVMFSYISQRNIESMLVGNTIAVLLIALIMIAALRNVQLGTLSLIPNVLPILITYGVWTLLVGHIGMASATVSATSLGIIVDDSVHFLTKYLRARRENGYNSPESIRYVFHTVGNALFFNSVILISGFAFLALSTFKVNLEMGLLTAIAILVALVFDFLILPALLLVGHQSTEKGAIYDEISHDNKYALQTAE